MTDKPRTDDAVVTLNLDGARFVEIYGVRYAPELFRVFAFAPIGTVVRIVDRADGLVTLETLETPQPTAQASEPTRVSGSIQE